MTDAWQIAEGWLKQGCRRIANGGDVGRTGSGTVLLDSSNLQTSAESARCVSWKCNPDDSAARISSGKDISIGTRRVPAHSCDETDGASTPSVHCPARAARQSLSQLVVCAGTRGHSTDISDLRSVPPPRPLARGRAQCGCSPPAQPGVFPNPQCAPTGRHGIC